MRKWYNGMTDGQRVFIWILSILLIPVWGIGLIPLAVLIYILLGDKNRFKLAAQAIEPEYDLTLFVDNKLIFKNPLSGRIKKIKVGFSWLGFLFDWITLLAKELIKPGLTILGINFAFTIIFAIVKTQSDYHYHRYGDKSDTDLIVFIVSILAGFLIKIIVGMYANLWQAKTLLKRGWILQNAKAAHATLLLKDWYLQKEEPQEANDYSKVGFKVKNLADDHNKINS